MFSALSQETCSSQHCVFPWWELRSYSSYTSFVASQATRSPPLLTVNLILGLPGWQVTGRVSILESWRSRQPIHHWKASKPNNAIFIFPKTVLSEMCGFFLQEGNLFSIQLFSVVATEEGIQYY